MYKVQREEGCNMIEYQEVTHKGIWDYLNKMVPYLTLEEIETLNHLFELMRNDYTPIQSFGDSKLEFVLTKELHPYVNPTMPCYFTSDGANDIINSMLESFDTAKGHMELNELFLMASILPMMNHNNMTIYLVEESGQFVLKINSRK